MTRAVHRAQWSKSIECRRRLADRRRRRAPKRTPGSVPSGSTTRSAFEAARAPSADNGDRAIAETRCDRALEVAPPQRGSSESCRRRGSLVGRHEPRRRERDTSQRRPPERAATQRRCSKRETCDCVPLAAFASQAPLSSQAGPPYADATVRVAHAAPRESKDLCGSTKSKWPHLQCEQFNARPPATNISGA